MLKKKEKKKQKRIIKNISLSTTGPEDLLTIKLINPAKCWLKNKVGKTRNNRINYKLLIH